MNYRNTLAKARAHNDAIRASMPPGSKFSGPRLDTVLEGWLMLGWNFGTVAHYWKRGHGDDARSICGLVRDFEHDIRGHLMAFEAGNFPRCARCVNSKTKRAQTPPARCRQPPL